MTSRQGICDVPGLDSRLILVLTQEPECHTISWLTNLECFEEIREAQLFLEQADFSHTPSASWRNRIPDFLQKGWGSLSHRERAIIYLAAYGE